MFLSTLVAALALQAPAAKPAPKPAPAPAPAPAAPAPKAEHAEGDRWIADFDQAVEIARKEGKDLLVDFTGSDWCGWCIKLHKEVFEFDSFLDATEEGYVLVSLDFPNSEAVKKKVPNPARNAELAKKYEIQGYPTVLLMTVDGEVFGKTGYKDGGPDKYVEHVKSLTTSGKKAMVEVATLAKDYPAAKGPAQAKLLDQAIALLDSQEEGSPFASKIAVIVRDAFKLDPDNKKGIKLKAVEALLKSGQSDEATNGAAKALDPKNEKGLLERVVAAQAGTIRSKEAIAPFLKSLDELLAAGKFKDVKIGKQLLSSATVMSKQHLQDIAKAKVYAQKLKELGIDGPDDEGLRQLVDEVMKATG
jgi:thioredoxin-related protein